jgi:hypothetical protein
MTGHWVMTDTDIHALLDVFDRCQPAADDDIFYADVLMGCASSSRARTSAFS